MANAAVSTGRKTTAPNIIGTIYSAARETLFPVIQSSNVAEIAKTAVAVRIFSLPALRSFGITS
jgi:hypothetical protein